MYRRAFMQGLAGLLPAWLLGKQLATGTAGVQFHTQDVDTCLLKYDGEHWNSEVVGAIFSDEGTMVYVSKRTRYVNCQTAQFTVELREQDVPDGALLSIFDADGHLLDRIKILHPPFERGGQPIDLGYESRA